MKGLLLFGASGAAVAAAGALGTASVSAHPAAHAATKTVVVAMRDPGCHWFQVGTNSFRTNLAVRGPVSLLNFDMGALKVAGTGQSKLDLVGHRLMLAHGTYRITMVGQAPDDNHLKLVVR